MFTEIPLTYETLDTVRRQWGAAPTVAERLHGGEESATYRLGDHVVRVGPTWRGTAELECCYRVASFAAREVPEALAPLATASGLVVARVDSRPVTVWPYVEGVWGDEGDRGQRRQAAALLARLHRRLAGWRGRARPASRSPLVAVPDLADPELDRWLADFDRRHPRRYPLHADAYPGNVLVREGRIVALLDWDEAIIGPPERELAWAAMEWGDGLWADTREAVHEFVAEYRSAGGPAEPLDDVAITQPYRERIRWEVAYARAARERGIIHDEDDREYEARQLSLFWRR